MECRWQVEIDPYAQRVLAKHWPNVRRWDDVRTWPQADTERVDCIIGGFPCQDISYAGRGAGLDGERSGLFFEAIRIVQLLEPRYVVLENVAALATRGLDIVLGTLASIGYCAEWTHLPAAAFGAPHIRDRIFIVGTKESYVEETFKRTGSVPVLFQGVPSEIRPDPKRKGKVLLCSVQQRSTTNKSERNGNRDGISNDDHRHQDAGREAQDRTTESRADSTNERSRYQSGEATECEGVSGVDLSNDDGTRDMQEAKNDGVGTSHRRGQNKQPVIESVRDDRTGAQADSSKDRASDVQPIESGSGDVQPRDSGIRTDSETQGDHVDGNESIPAAAVGAPHIRDRVFVLAHTDGSRRRQSNETMAGRLAEQSNSSGFLADADKQRSQGRVQNGIANPEGRQEPKIRRITERSDRRLWNGNSQWAVEPAICRISDEFSEGLDETGGLKPESHDTMGVQDTQERNSHADAKKTRPDQALPIMQKTVASQEIQRATGRPDGISAAEVLRSKVHGGGNDARRTSAGSTEETSGQVQREPLRTLRDSGRFTHPPHGYEPSEQRAIEPENALRIMSHIMALDARQPQEFSGEAAATVQRLRQGICEAKTGDVPETLSEVQEIWRSTSDQEKTWFIIRISSGNPWCSEWPGVPRVATGIPNRIDRLRGLGNAVVPAVAEWIGKQIVAEKAKHDGSDRN